MTGERRQAEKFGNGSALVDTGDPNLDHVMTMLHVERVLVGQLFSQLLRRLAHVGCAPVVQGGSQRLILEQQAVRRFGEHGELLLRNVQPVGAWQIFAFSSGEAPFRAMTARCRQADHAEPVQHLDRSPADQRKPALQTIIQFVERTQKLVGNVDGVGPVAQFDKRAVEIEEKRVSAEIE